MLRKVFVVPTVGERYNPNNPLRPVMPVRASLSVVKYINNDKQAIIVVYGNTDADFEPFRQIGKEIKMPNFSLAKYKRRVIKDYTIIDSTDETEIGTKVWKLYGLSKLDYLKTIPKFRRRGVR